ncbi:hypothetical protein V8E54_015045 [Elaphomyces granulatus]
MGHSKRTQQGKAKMTVESEESLISNFQAGPSHLKMFLAPSDHIPEILSILTAYEKNHADVNNQVEDSDTPSSIPNPTNLSLYKLDGAITSVLGGGVPLQKSLGSADYALSIMHIEPESLNSLQPYENGPKVYNRLLRTTRLYQATSTITLRTVALGRIKYKGRLTSWIVVWELRGNLFALRSDIVSEEELQFKEMDDDDLEASMEKLPPVLLPELEKWSSKAVYLGKTSLLGEKEVLGGLATKGGYRVLQVTGWESDLVSNGQAI